MRELSLHLLDIFENSAAAGARQVCIEIDEDSAADRLTIAVADDGAGMDEEALRRASDPFFTTRATRKVGLGLPLLKAAAERCGGALHIASRPGQGTQVRAEFVRSHIDRAPLGDMVGTLLAIVLSGRPCEVFFRHRLDGREFVLDTSAIRRELGEVPLAHPRVRDWLYRYIREGYAELYGAREAPQAQPWRRHQTKCNAVR